MKQHTIRIARTEICRERDDIHVDRYTCWDHCKLLLQYDLIEQCSLAVLVTVCCMYL